MDLFGGVIPIHGVTFLFFCVFSIIFLGYALGRINIKGVDLGTAGVFIVALVFGCIFYHKLSLELGEDAAFLKQALKVIENLGLILFVTTVGFIAGPKFFSNIKSNLKSYVLLGAVIIFSGALMAALCILFGRAVHIAEDDKLTAMVVGLFSGAMTSTPAFSAAKETVSAIDPAFALEDLKDIVSVGYGIAYIYGVIGVVLFVQVVPKLVHADMGEELRRITAVSNGKERKPYAGKLVDLDPFGLGAFALCVLAGIVLGMIKIPLSSKGLSGTTFSLTTTGGCLLAALVFGHFSHFGRLNVMPPQSMLKVFREFGLVLFLIGAGVSGGAAFLANFKFLYFVFGIFITTASMVVGYFFATKVLKLKLLNALSAITGGMTSTPALGTLIAVAGSEEVASAYAATYPFALICVVLSTQFLNLLF